VRRVSWCVTIEASNAAVFHNRPSKQKPVVDMLFRLEKLNLTGPTDLSTNHDDYLYGDK
jgi:hypothetical protein